MRLAIVALFLSLLLQFSSTNGGVRGDPVVHTPLGALRGTTMTTRSGRTIYAFRGIRYAVPPVGELRFKAPLPVTEPWDGIKNATEDAASCPQASSVLKGPTSEDCLFLNVYSKKLPNENVNVSQPVIFWIHHGAWAQLSGQSSFLGPQYLMDEDITMVMINYRLGALGFFSTGDSEALGNYALKDQLLALKWVRDNIACFGGNPDSVTIYGYSAGAASVQYHMASTSSVGLFHRAISGSGSALCPWALNRNPKRLARRQAKLLNCPHDNKATSKQIVDCLRKKDAEEIAKSYVKLTEWLNDPVLHYSPVIEAEGSSDQPFLTEEPDKIFRRGDFHQVPWMAGCTDNEMMGTAAAILQNETILEDFSDNFERIAPIAFYYERGSPSSLRKSRKLKEFYFPHRRITKDSKQAITDLYSDGIFLHGVDRSVKLISAKSRAPVYYYQFVYRGRYGQMPVEPGMDTPPGVAHHDDLMYLFYSNSIPILSDGISETIMSKRMVRMWVNFARTGNPTPNPGSSSDDLITTNWIPHTPERLSYMEIGDELTMKRALRQRRIAVWDDIYPLR